MHIKFKEEKRGEFIDLDHFRKHHPCAEIHEVSGDKMADHYCQRCENSFWECVCPPVGVKSETDRQIALNDAAKFCLERINYADSTMSHEELLQSVSAGILRL